MSRYIDADALKEKIGNTAFLKLDDTEVVEQFIDDAPTIDIVFCKECKHYDKFPTWSACTYWSGDPYEQASVNDDDFCSRGERREP